jgi:two-component system, OmpR family, phosphate regulon response regulator PhoB
MMTNASTLSPAALLEPDNLPAVTATQKVVIVNGNTEVLDLLETVLDAGHYDVVFVESTEHAYSQIKRVQPNLVILCVNVDSPNGFQVLSMLKLDAETRDIPVLTHTTDGDEEEDEEEAADSSEVELFAPPPAIVRMN